MIGRESKESNDIFFVCSLVEYIARKTKNNKALVVNAMGETQLQQVLNLADIYHSENIDKVSDDLIDTYKIEIANFDNISISNYNVPTIWDIAKVYKRLILDIAGYRNTNKFVEIMMEVFNSWIADKIDDFNSSLYFENPDYIFQTYLNGKMLE